MRSGDSRKTEAPPARGRPARGRLRGKWSGNFTHIKDKAMKTNDELADLSEAAASHEQELRLQAALNAIHGERAYQESKWPGHTHSAGEWILILDKLMADARRAWVTGHGDNAALHEVRQIGATALACLEQCGAPLRGAPLTDSKYPTK